MVSSIVNLLYDGSHAEIFYVAFMAAITFCVKSNRVAPQAFSINSDDELFIMLFFYWSWCLYAYDSIEYDYACLFLMIMNISKWLRIGLVFWLLSFLDHFLS